MPVLSKCKKGQSIMKSSPYLQANYIHFSPTDSVPLKALQSLQQFAFRAKLTLSIHNAEKDRHHF